MYKNIEKKYTELNPDNDFDKFYRRLSFITAPVFYVLFLISSHKILLFIIFILLLLLSIALYFIRDFKNFLNKNDMNLNLLAKFKVYFKLIDDKKISNLVELLKKYNINDKDKLQLSINYYNRKAPIKIESSLLGWVVSFAITLASIVSIGFDENTGKINYNKLNEILGSTLGILIIVLLPILSVRFAINALKSSKDELYKELEDNITHVYVNYDVYKKKLKNSR